MIVSMLGSIYSGRKCGTSSGRGKCVKSYGHDSDNHKDNLGQVFSVCDKGHVKILWLAKGAKI